MHASHTAFGQQKQWYLGVLWHNEQECRSEYDRNKKSSYHFSTVVGIHKQLILSSVHSIKSQLMEARSMLVVIKHAV